MAARMSSSLRMCSMHELHPTTMCSMHELHPTTPGHLPPPKPRSLQRWVGGVGGHIGPWQRATRRRCTGDAVSGGALLSVEPWQLPRRLEGFLQRTTAVRSPQVCTPPRSPTHPP